MPFFVRFEVIENRTRYLLKKALDEAGFDAENENHLLVCCGDLFDRGHENRKVYDFVRRLKNKVLVRGNHDERLHEILTYKRVNVYDMYNGTDVTLEEFFGEDCIGSYGELQLPAHGKMSGKLCRLIESTVDYYETENYVFVHGWVPINKDEEWGRVLENWREADEREWYSARFPEWPSLYKTWAMIEGKTVVCGHRPTRFAIKFDESRAPNDSSIFYGDGMIAIDAGTIRSGRVNVLVLEEKF